MANLVYIDRANPNGSKVLRGCELIREGIGLLKSERNRLAQARAVSEAEVEAAFGVQTGGGAAITDRVAAFLAFYEIPWGEPDYDSSSILQDLIDATISL